MCGDWEFRYVGLTIGVPGIISTANTAAELLQVQLDGVQLPLRQDEP